MTNLEQAARQALEALQMCANGEDDVLLTRDALAALRQALEQPTVKDCLKVEPKQEQEPYCWKVLGVVSEFTGYYAEEEAKATAKRIDITCEAFPLYTEPPKREWVGLTEEEAADCWSTSAVKSWKNIEAALKTKNT